MFKKWNIIRNLTEKCERLEDDLERLNHLRRLTGQEDFLTCRVSVLRSQEGHLEASVAKLSQQIEDLKTLRWEQKCAIRQEVEAITYQGIKTEE
jgi:chaperonin cofactor prefoldin